MFVSQIQSTTRFSRLVQVIHCSRILNSFCIIEHLNFIPFAVYCVEPEGKNLQQSFDSSKRSWDPEAGPVKTIADGIRVLRIGEKCFSSILEKCEKNVFTVVSYTETFKSQLPLIFFFLQILQLLFSFSSQFEFPE